MRYIDFAEGRGMDLICLGRLTVDLNPVDYYMPLSESTTFKRYVGGSPANIACGLARLGKRVGFIGKLSDDQFGDFVGGFFEDEGIDTSHVTRCTNGYRMGLTFTEILSETESSIMMYRDCVADLQLCVDDVDEAYIAGSKALLISGTSLCQSPSREAALKALQLAKKAGTRVIFDIDYRPYCWKSEDEVSVYYSHVAHQADIVMGSRAEFDLTERLIEPGRNDRQSADYWLGAGASIVIIKHGKEGSTAYTADGGQYSVKPFPVKLLKSFGGGDGYASAFLYGLFEGRDITECLEYGSASAAMLVASHACSVDMPTESELKAFIKKAKDEHGEMIQAGDK